MIFSNEGIPHALRALLVIPPVMIMAALGLSWIMRAISRWLAQKEKAYPLKQKQLKRIRAELTLLLLLFFAAGALQAYFQYFIRWGNDIQTFYAFSGNYVSLGAFIEAQPRDLEKYIIINAGGTEVPVPGSALTLPMPSQTVMFITNTWHNALAKEKNISYILPKDITTINCADHCMITMLEPDHELRKALMAVIGGLSPEAQADTIILKK
ncbi:MAG: hypothetical protein HY445_00580 [Candidatus Niyogibacteria bacterium]|nr:hypothetical protein [Candidatus Niyogibacteria bacterium]